jgi:hypothetical protein
VTHILLRLIATVICCMTYSAVLYWFPISTFWGRTFLFSVTSLVMVGVYRILILAIEGAKHS